MDQDPYNATLTERVDLNPELALFRVKYDDGHVPEFAPGQFATLGLLAPPEDQPKVDPDKPSRRRKGPKLIRRAYSIASPPTVTDYLEFYIVLVSDGQLTPKLWELGAGDRVWMGDKITGHFTLEGVPEGKDLVMLGTGTGVAPFRAMYHMHRGSGRWRNFVLFDGCRLAPDLGYRSEFTPLAAADDSFIYIPSVTREPEDSDYDGVRGRVTAHIEPEAFHQLTGLELNPETCHVFLCGNPQMIDQVEESLTARGFVTKDREHPDGNIHLERYW